VEAIGESRAGTAIHEDSLKLLEEALELFQRCLTLQEYQYSESQAQSGGSSDPQEEADDSQEMDGGVSLSDSQIPPPQDERWASIVEPVTIDSLLDTLLAQLETLTTLCGLVNADAGRGLSWVEEYSTDLVSRKLPVYSANVDAERAAEVALTRANFISALADANFRSQRIDLPTYERSLAEAYSGLDLSSNPEGLCDQADALLAFNTTLRNFGIASPEATTLRWQALSLALKNLTAASKLPDVENVHKIHLARGDAELLRFQLGQAPTSFQPAAANAPTLLKNAAVYYRGGAGFAKNEGLLALFKEGTVKEAVAASLAGDKEKLTELLKLEREACREVLEEAIDDGVVLIEWLEGSYNVMISS
jgi:tetratricopeptide (TPR) repeat protein